MAFKCSYVEGYEDMPDSGPVDAHEQLWTRDVFKDPITDPGKASKRGKLKLCRAENGQYFTQPVIAGLSDQDHLVEVFRDGRLLVRYDLASIRQRAAL